MDSIGEADSVTNVDDITDAGISGFSYEYGVFLSAEPGDVDAMKEYRCVVIDAQEFSAEDIRRMHDLGQTVYSYINIGSVEKFRDYYGDYADTFVSRYLEDGAELTRPCSLSLKEHGIGHDGSSFLVPKNIKKCLTVHWWTAVLCAKPEKKGLYIPEFHA
ncbi:MAG: hypothetical protein KBS63_04585 [Clostridiales bacterium]|nr:hypothetical protein [Candidatus Crickella caballi]